MIQIQKYMQAYVTKSAPRDIQELPHVPVPRLVDKLLQIVIGLDPRGPHQSVLQIENYMEDNV